MYNPAPANRRRDPSDSIGVVFPDIFGAPDRGRSCENLVWLEQRLHRGHHSKEEGDRTSGIICGCGKRSRGDRKAKSCEPLSNSFMYKVVFLRDPALGMRNLHAMGAFRYRQRPCSVSSPLNSSSGRAENGKVVYLAASTPGQLLRIHPQNTATWVYAPASLTS